MSAPDRLVAALKGRYRIEREVGAGGMATVYLADDQKHDRKVALKVLKPELAAVVGAERFVAEIRTTANLRHPHILPLFDSGEADGFLYYVMPYVEGESLRERLDRERELPVDEAVVIATKVAGALQAAHEAGVIHRDIKPANILLERGEPVVADFGIALAVQEAGGGRLTETGLSLGTPYYMSPEQATGDRSPDARSDVYALAAVLYEMLTGEPPHTGSSAQAVLGRILTEAPRDVSTIRSTAPPNVAGAIARALERLPADRFASAAEFSRALNDAAFDPGPAIASDAGTRSPRKASSRRSSLLPWALVFLLGALAIAQAVWSSGSPRSPDPPATYARLDLDDVVLGFRQRIEVSRDGTTFATAGTRNGAEAIYVRRASEPEFRALTDGSASFVMSPMGDWIAFREDDGALSRVPIAGGLPRPLVAVSVDRGSPVGWARDGRVFFNIDDALYSVPEEGGDPTPVYASAELGPLDDIEVLPNGVLLATAFDREAVVVVDPGSGTHRVVVDDAVSPSLVEGGTLLYVDLEGRLWAAPFDEDGAALAGPAVPLFEGVFVRSGTAWYSVSDGGTMVFTDGGEVDPRQRSLGYASLDGGLVIDSISPLNFGDPVWSPEGDRIAFRAFDGPVGGVHLYVYDAQTGRAPTPLTSEGENTRPIWSPDGRRIVFGSRREGSDGRDLYVVDVEGSRPPQRLLSMPGDQVPSDWFTPDSILFESGEPTGVWLADLTAPESVEATEILAGEEGRPLTRPLMHPGREWIAYMVPGQNGSETEVTSFPRPGRRIPAAEFARAFWSLDGSTLYYWSFDGGSILHAADLEVGESFRVLRHREVMRGPYWSTYSGLDPSGERVIVLPPRERSPAVTAADATEIVRHFIIVGWFAELRTALGADN